MLEVHWVNFRQACDMALSGELRDAKTTIGVLRAAHHLGLSLTAADDPPKPVAPVAKIRLFRDMLRSHGCTRTL